MRKFILVISSLFLLAVAASSPVAATTINGPVGITVGSDTYATYYTTVQYEKILENYTTTVGAGVTAPTDNPNNLIGIKDATPLFSQPWWVGGVDPTGAAAQSAAIQWFNTSGFPINQGVQLPNGSQTPYFVYATGDSADQVRYAYAYYDSGAGKVVSAIAQSDIVNDTFSYALAGPLSN